MASEDVIELGSSDDEAEPAPKKIKPAPNAMVHFPSKVPGLVIKSTKPVVPPLQKVLAGGAITITNSKTGKQSQQGLKIKPNKAVLKPTHKVIQRFPQRLPTVPPNKPIIIQNNLSINPLNYVKTQQTPKLSLPPGITVKRTAAGQQIMPAVSVIRKKHIIKRKPPEKIITTVELDDEVEPEHLGTSQSSPQWYLRPEEQTDEAVKNEEADLRDATMETENSMEVENNREPEADKCIEITIEDSPIKPVQSKRAQEIGTDLAITIEDSPVKAALQQPCLSGSDNEEPSTSTPHSKKKLEYQKNKDKEGIETDTQNVVEIDLDKCTPGAEMELSKDSNLADKTEPVDNKEEKTEAEVHAPRRIQPVLITKDVEKINDESECTVVASEFHPVYQRFIDLCFTLENSDDMKKIVEKKIKTYYRQCPKEYVESEEFIDMVSSKIFAMRAAPDKMYLYIKDIVDELNMQRKTAKAVEISSKENKKAEKDTYFCAEETKVDSKKARQIRKLEKTIKKIHRAIQKLEEQEVDFEDEEDSVYLLTERYKERLVRVHAKFCQVTNTKMPSEPRIQIEARPGQPTGPAKRLEKWVNRKVPIGTPLPFPDFHDVLRCVRDANEEDRLGWNEADIMEEARDLFTRCGKKLQRRRQENEWRIAASRITHDVPTSDPAENSDVLTKKLDENKTVAAKKEIELLNKYADKQNQLKLVAEEIGDKEAEESPVESEDDEANEDDNSLEDKQKRKERLRRLLHKKTMKMTAEKENNPISETKDKNEESTVKVEVEKKKDEEKFAVEVKENNDKEIKNDEQYKEEVVKETIVEEVSNDPSTEDSSIPESSTNNNSKEKQDDKKDSEVYDVDSDIDELHLLQKLYSENEINSSTNESDSDSPIAISDTLDSESETEGVKQQRNDDIISIENSSYSESEVDKDERPKELESELNQNKKIDNLLLENNEIELSAFERNKDDECDNILLASSDEEKDDTKKLQCNFKNKSKSEILLYFAHSNDTIDEVILDDCDENLEENNMITEVAENNDDVLENQEYDVMEHKNYENIEEFSKEPISFDPKSVNSTNDDIVTMNESCLDENNGNTLEASCEDIATNDRIEELEIADHGSGEVNNEEVNNVIEGDGTNHDSELNNTEKMDVAYNIDENNFNVNNSLQKEKVLDESQISQANGDMILRTENKFIDCELEYANTEKLESESSESFKRLQANQSEDGEISDL